jgi:ketosteroid isomerase-like protein
MSQENVEIVARLVDAWNQANVEAILALFDPECEVIFPPEVPEPGPFHGHTELREWAEGFLAAWESHHAEVVELIEADHSIVAILHLIGRGSGSGIEMDETDATSLHSATGRSHVGGTSATAPKPSKLPGCGSSGFIALTQSPSW